MPGPFYSTDVIAQVGSCLQAYVAVSKGDLQYRITVPRYGSEKRCFACGFFLLTTLHTGVCSFRVPFLVCWRLPFSRTQALTAFFVNVVAEQWP